MCSSKNVLFDLFIDHTNSLEKFEISQSKNDQCILPNVISDLHFTIARKQGESLTCFNRRFLRKRNHFFLSFLQIRWKGNRLLKIYEVFQFPVISRKRLYKMECFSGITFPSNYELSRTQNSTIILQFLSYDYFIEKFGILTESTCFWCSYGPCFTEIWKFS